MKRLLQFSGILSVAVFAISFALFSFVAPSFDPIQDFISKLGAKGQPHSLVWNLIGFCAVGMGFCTFGVVFGLSLGDKVVAVALLTAGIGFAMAGIPSDFSDASSSFSRIHFASVCISLGGWFIALSRLTRYSYHGTRWQFLSKMFGIAGVLPLVLAGAEFCPAPIAHRLILCSVFGWVVMVSVELNRDRNALK